MTATTILVSRFPGYVTPGALPMLPEVVSIHDAAADTFIVFRWFVDGDRLEQSNPVFCSSLGEALALVPEGYEQVTCPADFGRAAYRAPRAR